MFEKEKERNYTAWGYPYLHSPRQDIESLMGTLKGIVASQCDGQCTDTIVQPHLTGFMLCIRFPSDSEHSGISTAIIGILGPPEYSAMMKSSTEFPAPDEFRPIGTPAERARPALKC